MREDIKHIVNALKCICAGNQTATDSLTQLESILAALDLANFDVTPGNSKEFTYYTAGVPVPGSNPSGNKNIETIVYKTGVTTVLTQTITYDSDDDILTITAS